MGEPVQLSAEQVAQLISEVSTLSAAVNKLLQATGSATVGTTVQSEIGDIGGTEAHERSLNDETGLLFTNAKRTYDEYQEVSLESIKRSRTYIDKVLSDAQGYDNNARNIANQALQNAVENANFLAKRSLQNFELATDRQWNVNETDYAAASIIDSMNAPAVKQAMAATIAEILAAMAAEKKAQ